MPQAAMLYARHLGDREDRRYVLGFNAASGNAIRATIGIRLCNIIFTSFNAASGNAIRATKFLRLIMEQKYGFNAASGNAIRAT